MDKTFVRGVLVEVADDVLVAEIARLLTPAGLRIVSAPSGLRIERRPASGRLIDGRAYAHSWNTDLRNRFAKAREQQKEEE